MAAAMSARAKLEADALLTTLRMAERHQQWGLFASMLTFIRDAGWRFVYLGPGTYALAAPPHFKPKDPQ
jgi:hypothetical protein